MFNELLKNVMNLGIITEDDVKRLTAIELMMLIIERTNGLLNHVEMVDEKLVNLLENIKTTTIEQLNNWKEDGTLDELINQSALKEVNDRIDETNAQLSESIIKSMEDLTYVRPEWFDSFNDDDASESIQEAIDTGKAVKLDSKSYYISKTLCIHDNTFISGNGKNTKIVVKPHANMTDAIKVSSESVKNVTLKDFHLYGDIKNQTSVINGINLSTSFDLPYDARQTIKDVFIEQFTGTGLIMHGRGGSLIENVQILWTTKDGFDLNLWDSIIMNCNAGSIQDVAFKINGASNRFTNCKGWWSTKGFTLTGNRNHLTLCEAQDCLKGGFEITKAYDNRLDACYVDGVGERGEDFRADNIPAFVVTKDCGRNFISATITDRREYHKDGTVDYALDLQGGYYNEINLVVGQIKKGAMKTPLTTHDNTVTIIGHDINNQNINYSSLEIDGKVSVTSVVTNVKDNFLSSRNKTSQIKLTVTLTPSEGVIIGTISDLRLRPAFYTDIISACYNSSNVFVGTCSANISPNGGIDVWNIPAETTKIVVSGVYNN